MGGLARAIMRWIGLQTTELDTANADWQRDLVAAMVDYARVARNPEAVLSQATGPGGWRRDTSS